MSAVVDTAALLGCAGDGALDDFIKAFSVADNRDLKGVSSSAPSVPDELQWLPMSLNGLSAKIALHRLPKSQVPMLLGLPQLKSLGEIIDLRTRMVLKLLSRKLAMRRYLWSIVRMDI